MRMRKKLMGRKYSLAQEKTPPMPSKSSQVRIRPATLQDSAACGHICYQAFSTLNASHNFPSDLPDEEAAVGLLSNMFSTPGLYSVIVDKNLLTLSARDNNEDR
jgi:hypothetical protein